MARLTILADEEAVARTAAERVTALANAAIADHDIATVCLTGGRTPKRLYELLPTGPLDWRRVHLAWGDERHVAPDHEDSNFKMANDALISRIAIPPANVHRIPAELPDAEEAARAYAEEIRGIRFDVMLLGLGEDGHVASIFPGSDVIGGADLVRSADAKLPPFVTRITLTPAAILNSEQILMIVAGEKKAAAVEAALKLPEDLARWPVQLLRAAGDRVEWLMDSAAASRL